MARPTTALIVDDEPHVRTFMKLILKEVGIATCWEASSGVEALELEAKHHPDLMLLDINLPVMGGLEVLSKLREANSEIAVVVFTSQTAMNTVSEAVRLGAAGYILKHSPREEAVEALRDVIEELSGEGDGSDEPAS
jgi:two-component system, chemotaxis family, chemotaxis protein CheY